MDPKNPLLQAFQRPTVDNVRLLEQYVDKDAKEICAKGQDTLLLTGIFTMIAEFPDMRNKNELINRLISTAITLISHSRIRSMMSMQTMLVILLKNIGVGPAYMTIHSHLSEELKLAAINCFEIIFRKATPEVIRQFYIKDHLNILAQVLSICENILSKENYRQLRIASIKCMMSIFQVHNECDMKNTKQRKHMANLTFLLIPKIMSTLNVVATGGQTIGDNLITCSIAATHRILHLIFDDYTDNSNSTPNLMDLMKMSPSTSNPKTSARSSIKTDDKSRGVMDRLSALESKQRNDEWLSTASTKLCLVIERLKPLCGHDSKEIRKELYQLSDNLLCHCQRNMVACVPALLEINVCLNGEFECKSSSYDEQVIDIAEMSFSNHLIRLPRIIFTGDETEQIVAFRQLHGIVRLLHDTNRLKITMSNDDITQKFMRVLLLTVELERDNKLLEVNNHIYDVNDASGVVQSIHIAPWKNFKNLRSSKIMSEIRRAFICINEQNQTYTFILEYLLKLLAKNAINCNEALVLIQLFLDCREEHSDTTKSLHLSILENLLLDYRWHLQTHVDSQMQTVSSGHNFWYEDHVEGLYESAVSVRFTDIPLQDSDTNRNEAITMKDIKNNILHICLVIETIGCYAGNMQQQYQVHLMKALPHLIEKSSSAHYLIRVSALMALEKLKVAFKLQTIADLIFVNADYVTQTINTSLKKSHQIDDALRILNTASYYNSIGSIPHLEGVVLNMIDESGKLKQSKNMLSFLHAFKCVLMNIRQHNTTEPSTNNDRLDCELPNRRPYFDEWLGILKAVPSMEEDLEAECDENDADLNECDAAAEDTKMETNDQSDPPLPPYIKLTVNIIKHCVPHIATDNVDIKLVALECLTIGLDLIKDTESELLPIVHSIWAPFMEQYIRNENTVVLRYSFRFLKQVAIHAKDFIHQRYSSQLLPNIIQFLKEQSKSYTSEKRPTIYDQEFKTLKEILCGLPVVLKSLNIQEKDLDNVLDAVLWLLGKNHPETLRDLGTNFIQELESFDICAIHVKLMNFK